MNRHTVALSGLAEADTDTVRAALQRAELANWDMGEASDANVLIVDVDSVWGHMDWLKATAGGRCTVAYSDQPPSDPAEAFLTKPLQPDTLARLLTELAAGLPGHTAQSKDTRPAESTAPAQSAAAAAGTVRAEPARDANTMREAAPAAPAAKPKPKAVPDEAIEQTAAPATPKPAPATVGAWLLAGLAREPFALSNAHGERLLVDPEKQVYHGPALLKPLIPLLERSPDALERPNMSELATLAAAELPLNRLLWLAALTRSPGQIADSTDASTVFRLERWPQIEREFPRHFRIATAMMKQPGSLGELASTANTSEADVADFINAYTAIGYVSRHQPSESKADDRLPLLRNPFARNTGR